MGLPSKGSQAVHTKEVLVNNRRFHHPQMVLRAKMTSWNPNISGQVPELLEDSRAAGWMAKGTGRGHQTEVCTGVAEWVGEEPLSEEDEMVRVATSRCKSSTRFCSSALIASSSLRF